MITTDLHPTLRDIVGDWINEGFTTPPYTDQQYAIFEELGLDPEGYQYDIVRPGPTCKATDGYGVCQKVKGHRGPHVEIQNGHLWAAWRS